MKIARGGVRVAPECACAIPKPTLKNENGVLARTSVRENHLLLPVLHLAFSVFYGGEVSDLFP